MNCLLLVSVAMFSAAEPATDQTTAELVVRLTQVVADPSANLWSKKEALRTLAKFGSHAKPAVEPLVRQFGRIRRGEDLALQEAIIEALGKIGPAARGASPTLANLVGQDIDIDRAVVRAIDQIMAPPERFEVQELVRELRRNDASQRLRAVKALAAMGRNAESAIPDLLNMLRDSDADVRRVTISALRAIQPDLKPGVQLIDAYILDLQDADDGVRLLAAKALGKIGPAAAAAIPALQKLQSDAVADVRQAANDALARVTSQQ